MAPQKPNAQVRIDVKMADVVFIGFPCLVFYYSSAAFWKANLAAVSSAFLKLDRWIIMINATPLFMSIQA
jgi:hypothetical protein